MDPHDDPGEQRVISHDVSLDSTIRYGVDDMVQPIRARFGGRGGSGCQLAIALTQIRAFSLFLIPGKCRRSSTTADSSPLSWNT
jgi:hypothetical protein